MDDLKAELEDLHEFERTFVISAKHKQVPPLGRRGESTSTRGTQRDASPHNHAGWVEAATNVASAPMSRKRSLVYRGGLLLSSSPFLTSFRTTMSC